VPGAATPVRASAPRTITTGRPAVFVAIDLVVYVLTITVLRAPARRPEPPPVSPSAAR
jgi:hypothetical protein